MPIEVAVRGVEKYDFKVVIVLVSYDSSKRLDIGI